MDINFNNTQANSEPPKKKNTKKKLLITILVFVILTCVVNSLILADAIHTKYVTYKTIGSLVEGADSNDKKAANQGNLGNYNIASKKNSLIDNKNGTFTLTIEAEFTNFGEEGRSFIDAVSVTAYQNDKEIRGGVSAEYIKGDESEIKVRNGQKANVILTYLLTDTAQDINIDMTAGSNEFTYTVKLGGAQPQQEEAQSTTAQQKEAEDKKETTANNG